MPLLPPPAAVVARTLPAGLPLVRDELVRRTGFGRNSLDRDATPGDPGLFGPGSATWELMGHPSAALAGLRAALLQALSAPIPTATHSTGAFERDFMGRVSRTGEFVTKQNLGSMDEVHRSARRVRAMHRTVVGTWKDGLEFDAGDPHQQAWVSMTLTDSFLVVAEQFGPGGLRGRRADEFVREQSTHGALLDPRVDLDDLFADPGKVAALQAGTLPLPLIEEGELPVTRTELEEKMRAWTDELVITDLTRALIDATVQLTPLPAPQRAVARLFVLATLSTVPDHLHELLAPGERRLEERVAAQAVQGPLALLQGLFGRGDSVAVAHRRAQAA
jgi:uncharacterized protein (DUF2236 family)